MVPPAFFYIGKMMINMVYFPAPNINRIFSLNFNALSSISISSRRGEITCALFARVHLSTFLTLRKRREIKKLDKHVFCVWKRAIIKTLKNVYYMTVYNASPCVELEPDKHGRIVICGASSAILLIRGFCEQQAASYKDENKSVG